MDMAFAKAKSGLLVPSPGGLVGFQRQGMDQRKKASGVSFVGVVNVASAAASLTFPANAAAGDLAVVLLSSYNTGASLPAGWTAVAENYNGVTYQFTVAWKVLTGGDLAGVAVTNPSAGDSNIVLVYRGVTSAAVVSALEAGTAVTADIVPGFAPSGSTGGVVALGEFRTSPSVATFTVGGGFTQRGAQGVGGTFFSCVAADLLSGYVSGSSVTFNLSAAEERIMGVLVELRF